MSISSKHMATFIIGAAAGVALHKFLQTEDGEKLLDDLKTKAGELKDEAEEAMEKAPEYFEELRTKGAETLKTNFPDADKFLRDLLGSLSGKKAGPAPGDSPAS